MKENRYKGGQETGMLPGIFLILGIILPLIIGYTEPVQKLREEMEIKLLGSFYIFYIGTLFLLSYYYEKKTFLFRALIWVCERFSSPSSKKMAFFYFGLCSILSIISAIHNFTTVK